MILSGTAIIPKGDTGYPGVAFAILAYLICAIVLLVRRHHIEPASPQFAAAP